MADSANATVTNDADVDIDVSPALPPRRSHFAYPISRSERLRLALELGVHPDSIERELRGERVARISGERVREALKLRGVPTSDGPAIVKAGLTR